MQDCTRYLLPVQDMGGSSNAESVRIECLPVCVKKGVVTGTQMCLVWIQIPVPVRYLEIKVHVMRRSTWQYGTWYIPVVRHRQLVVWNLVPLVPANCDLRVYSKGDAEKTQAGKNS